MVAIVLFGTLCVPLFMTFFLEMVVIQRRLDHTDSISQSSAELNTISVEGAL
ncbi:MAG: hypothetical protein KGJ12_06075 [Gammaproteobacteria bacterium]|nr:hypothetical protein [Gammaproteobacteria bacterium]